jgi:hypothetical protein
MTSQTLTPADFKGGMHFVSKEAEESDYFTHVYRYTNLPDEYHIEVCTYTKGNFVSFRALSTVEFKGQESVSFTTQVGDFEFAGYLQLNRFMPAPLWARKFVL